MCFQYTRVIQVLTRTDRSTIVPQCSLRAPTLTPKYIPSGISFLASSVLCAEPAYPIGPNRLGTQPNRSVPTDSVLGFFSRSGRCWACISTLFYGHFYQIWWVKWVKCWYLLMQMLKISADFVCYGIQVIRGQDGCVSTGLICHYAHLLSKRPETVCRKTLGHSICDIIGCGYLL